ncbi:MAG: hypothetical protein K9L71_01065 [Candidatus Omnitrophica bacterium]|nr:hypothetical protein [Candidatus Omnitrophota bacterium]
MKKGVVLIIVFGILIVVFLLAIAAINLIRQQSKVTEHKISRRYKLLTVQAGMIHAMEELRKGNIAAPYNASMPTSINGYTPEITVLSKGTIGWGHACPPTISSDNCVFIEVD